MKKILILFIFFFIGAFLYAESDAEKLYKQNKPNEAIPLFEKDILTGAASPSAYNYLGVCYYQIGNYEKSIETFQKGLSVSGTNKKVIAFNAGNSCYAIKDYKKAIEYYSLALMADPNYSAAVLNRANANLMAKEYDAAVADYKKFLILEPDDPQDPQIIKLIELLTREIERLEEERLQREEEERRFAEEERRFQEEMARLEAERAEQERLKKEEEERLAAEKAEQERLRKEEEERLAAERKAEEERIAAAKRAEEERIAAEKKAAEERLAAEKRAEEERIAAEKRAAEEERRRKLLEEVAASLQNTDSTNMVSGAEDLIDYEQESELD